MKNKKLKKVLTLALAFTAIATPAAIYFINGGTIASLEQFKDVIASSTVGFISGAGGVGAMGYFLTNGLSKTNSQFTQATNLLNIANSNLEDFVARVEEKILESNKKLLDQVEQKMKNLIEKSDKVIAISEEAIIREDKLNKRSLEIVSTLTNELEKVQAKEKLKEV